MAFQNIDASVKDGKLVLVIDLAQDHGPSDSGKMIMVARTLGGFTQVPGTELKINLQLGKANKDYVKPPKK